jgi:hypothetical protein
MVYEHDYQVQQAVRVLNERHDEIVNFAVAQYEDNRRRYGTDPRNWPQQQRRSAPTGSLNYGDMLGNAIGGRTPVAPPTPTPTPAHNGSGLPPLGGPESSIPQTETEPAPGPAPTPATRPVRRGTIPLADPEQDFRVRQPIPTPTPTPRPSPTPHPTPTPARRPALQPTVLTEVRRDTVDELGHPREGGGTESPSPSMIDAIMSRIPRNADGSIDWARVPIAIRAQVILYESRSRSGAGAGAGGGAGGGTDKTLHAPALQRRRRRSRRATPVGMRWCAIASMTKCRTPSTPVEGG